jgi:methylated-DNA-protein-cysteine methyltransferase-like protein
MARRRSRNAPEAGAFQSIWEVVARVPRGSVVTYGQVARMAGMPGAARTVGWAVQALPDDHRIRGRSIPWHRVINVQGRVSPRGETEEGGAVRRQLTLLRREGIRVSPAGVIDLDRYLWTGRPVRKAGR